MFCVSTYIYIDVNNEPLKMPVTCVKPMLTFLSQKIILKKKVGGFSYTMKIEEQKNSSV